MSSVPGSEQFTLIRYAYLPMATLGRLVLPGVPYALFTIERPWIQNPAGLGGMPRVSCVPDGLYALRPHSSEKHPNTFELVNESLGVYADALPGGQSWGRTSILIHAANQADELEGCIAPGSQIAIYNNTPSVLMSADAVDVVRSKVPSDRKCSLWIRPSTGTREIVYAAPPRSGVPRVTAPTMV